MINKIFLFPLSLSVVLFSSIIIIFSPLGSKKIINVSALCRQDSDCVVNSCTCQAIPKANMDTEGRICTRYCPGVAVCENSKCILKQDATK
jgi:hypothetical protein